MRTFEDCLKCASVHKSLGDWQRKDPASYRFAVRRNWQIKIAEKFGWKRWKPKTFYTPGDSYDKNNPRTA